MALGNNPTQQQVVTEVKRLEADKQNNLSAQTAYSAKGTTTKVPQITTNSLGQVTLIEEKNIAFPVTSVNGNTGAVTGLAETNQTFAKVYKSISEVSSSLTTSSTMLDVMNAMDNNSFLQADISTYTNLLPDSTYKYGVIEINKMNVNRCSAKYIALSDTASTSDVKMWVGEFQSAVSGYEWSGWKEAAQTTQTYNKVYKTVEELGLTAPTTVIAIVQKMITDSLTHSVFICTNNNNNNFTDAPDSYGTLIIETGGSALRPLITFVKQVGDASNFHQWTGNVVRLSGNTVSSINWREICDLSSSQTISGAKTFTGALYKKSTTIDIDTTETLSGVRYNYIDFTDKDNDRIGVIGVRQDSDKSLAVYFQLKNTDILSCKTSSTGTNKMLIPNTTNDVSLGASGNIWLALYTNSVFVKNISSAYNDTPEDATQKYLHFYDKNNVGIVEMYTTVGKTWNALNYTLRNKNNETRNIEFCHEVSADNWRFCCTTTGSVDLGISGRRWRKAYVNEYYEGANRMSLGGMSLQLAATITTNTFVNTLVNNNTLSTSKYYLIVPYLANWYTGQNKSNYTSIQSGSLAIVQPTEQSSQYALQFKYSSDSTATCWYINNCKLYEITFA